jgi:hypothetical protein
MLTSAMIESNEGTVEYRGLFSVVHGMGKVHQ